MKVIGHIRYADDTKLPPSHEEEMINSLRTAEQINDEVGLQVNRDKTNIIITDRQDTGQITDLILMDSQITDSISGFQVIDYIIYLGSLIANVGGCTGEIKVRLLGLQNLPRHN